MEGLYDKRLTQASHRRAPLDEVLDVCNLYQEKYSDFNAKHFYRWYQREHDGERSYTWVKNTLQNKGHVQKGRKKGPHRKKRERSPYPGMMIHQDGSTHEWVPGRKWDLIVTMDDATNEHYSMFFVWVGENIKDILCKHHKRTVNNNYCLTFRGLTLQIPTNQYRCHYVKVKVRVNLYDDKRLAVFHGPRKLATYDSKGNLLESKKIQAA